MFIYIFMHIRTPSIKKKQAGLLLVLNLQLSGFEDVLDKLQFQHETFSLCIPQLPAPGATLTSAPCSQRISAAYPSLTSNSVSSVKGLPPLKKWQSTTTFSHIQHYTEINNKNLCIIYKYVYKHNSFKCSPVVSMSCKPCTCSQ